MSTFQDSQQLRTIRAELNAFLGIEELKLGHKPILWLDIMVIFLIFLFLLGNYWILATINMPWYGLFAVALFQGWLMTIMGLVGHDLFVHRQMMRGPLGTVFSTLIFVPAAISLTRYSLGHLRHHSYVGTPEDTEVYKQDLNTIARRFFFTTIIGFKMAVGGKWSNRAGSGYAGLVGAESKQKTKSKIENLLILLYILCVGVFSYFSSWQVFFIGLLIPLTITMPLFNTFRIIIEHADMDPENNFWIATAYETGFLSRWFFFADAGDCHLIHHIYPMVPWYRMGRLVKLTKPFFESKGVQYRSSYIQLLKGWFLNNYPHRSIWPVN